MWYLHPLWLEFMFFHTEIPIWMSFSNLGHFFLVIENDQKLVLGMMAGYLVAEYQYLRFRGVMSFYYERTIIWVKLLSIEYRHFFLVPENDQKLVLGQMALCLVAEYQYLRFIVPKWYPRFMENLWIDLTFMNMYIYNLISKIYDFVSDNTGILRRRY